MTLRLAVPERYQVQAVDPVGRALWSLDVAEGRGVFVNHRSRTSCVFAGSFDLSEVPLGPFPLLTLPALLLGRVPSTPASEPKVEGRQVTFRDGGERTWSVTLDSAGEVEGWTLAEGKEPTVWWIRQESWAILSDRARGVQLRWREVLAERLDRELAVLPVPPGYREEPCNETSLEERQFDSPSPGL
jgi:hypothetical protein